MRNEKQWTTQSHTHVSTKQSDTIRSHKPTDHIPKGEISPTTIWPIQSPMGISDQLQIGTPTTYENTPSIS